VNDADVVICPAYLIIGIIPAMMGLGTGAVHDYFETVASRYGYDSSHFPWAWLRHQESKALESLLDQIESPCHRALDLGCGQGYYLRKLLIQRAEEVVGLDISPAMLAQIELPNVIARQGDFTSPLCGFSADYKFDLLFCAGALEFAPNPQTVIENVGQLLRPGGHFILLAPRKGLLSLGYQAFHRSHGLPIQVFSQAYLTQVCRRQGLLLKVSRRVTPFNLAFRFLRE